MNMHYIKTNHYLPKLSIAWAGFRPTNQLLSPFLPKLCLLELKITELLYIKSIAKNSLVREATIVV